MSFTGQGVLNGSSIFNNSSSSTGQTSQGGSQSGNDEGGQTIVPVQGQMMTSEQLILQQQRIQMEQEHMLAEQQMKSKKVSTAPVTGVRKTSCDLCTSIKVKCSGETPCQRCRKKGVNCVYSLSKKRGPPKGKKRQPNQKKAKPAPSCDPVSSDALEQMTNVTRNYPPTCFDANITVEMIRHAAQSFADERDWSQFHTPRNLVLALVGEVGELAEVFQWKDTQVGLTNYTPKERSRVAEELADVFIYLARLSDRCGIDLPTVVLEKMEKNKLKYPVDKAKGNCKKYTELQPSSIPPPPPASNSSSKQKNPHT